MKRLLLSLAVLLSPIGAFAIEPATVNRSSFIAGANQTGYIPAEYLDKVIVGEATAGGNITIYNSSWTLSVVISSISLATVGTHDFSNTRVKGVAYILDTPTNGVTILYKN